MVGLARLSRQDISYTYYVAHSFYYVAICHVYADANDDPFALARCRRLSPQNKRTLPFQEPSKPRQIYVADLPNLNGWSCRPFIPQPLPLVCCVSFYALWSTAAEGIA